MKICSKCKIEKESSEFYKDKSTKDGFKGSCRSCDLARSLAYAHSERGGAVRKKYANRDDQKAYRKEKDRSPEYKAKAKERYRKNAPKIAAYKNQYVKNRKAIDPLYKLTMNIRALISLKIRCAGYTKRSKTHEILGCTFEQLMTHLKETAINTYGGWHARIAYHIDHIIPLATVKTEEEVYKLNHYTNLQYLLPIDNLKKGATV